MSEPWWISLIKAVIFINILLVAMAFLTLWERKLLARMQRRYGPNRAGPRGILQPFADLIKMVRKEAFAPMAAIDILYLLAPAFAAFTALAAFSVIPWGEGWQIWHYHVNGEIADVPISLILIFALGSLGIYGFIIGGWASESKYSLLGSMRTCAQMVSYEVSLALSVLGVVLMAHTLSIAGIVQAQVDSWWYAAPQFVGPLWFFIKLLLAVSVFIWLRATLPRLRYDQLMRFGWKVLLPVATINAVVTALFVVIF
jgi:NADH-quinone oxidoreductase subunit H